MGSVCCVAAKDRNLHSEPGTVAIHNPVCSPPWSFRRDNRRRVADEIKDSSFHNSYVGNRGISMDKMSLGFERGPPSDNGSFPTSQRSANSEMATTSSTIQLPLMGTSPIIQSPSDVSLASPVSVEVKNLVDSPDIVSSPSVDQQSCRNCSKLLTERSSNARFDLPISAVLACGHVYHAACLETVTSETEKYDPMCPICTVGKSSRKAELKAKNYRRCKSRVVDSYVRSEGDDFVFYKMGKREGNALKMDPSSSTKGSTSKSFTKWNFGSISSKWNKTLARDSSSKKSFWSRHSDKRPSHSSSSIEGLNLTT